MNVLFVINGVAILAAAFFSCTDAFAFAPVPTSTSVKFQRDFQLQSMSMDDSPSDTSSDLLYEVDEVVTVKSEESPPLESEDLVANVLDLIPNVSDDETRSEINEVLLKLESVNPTENPATSALLNGVWNLQYSGLKELSKGSLFSPTLLLMSPAMVVLQLAKQIPFFVDIVESPSITISRDSPRVEASLKFNTLFGGEESLAVKINLEEKSDIRLSERYECAKISNQFVDLPKLLQYTREIYVTYVDEDVLVIRNNSGVPEILIRSGKLFTGLNL